MTMQRKIAFVERVINHVVDGDAVPKAVFATDPDFPSNHFLRDIWKDAAIAVREAWSGERD